ncbi:glycine zipper domain-containing protein [Akkermansiaceae bacterium]|nr:glycine zipper domain-containing protein [Akkermansiaceae bacterium]
MLRKLLKLSCVRVPLYVFTSASLFLSSCTNPAGGIAGIGHGGTIGPLSFDAQEQTIINQARMGGALLGAAAGYAIGQNNGGNGLEGALIGGLLGGLAGNAVGQGQARNAQNMRLSNEQFQRAIAITRQNNDRLEAYNRRVAARIAELRRKSAAERAQLAKAELGAVNANLKAAQSYTVKRTQSKAKLSRSQGDTYASEIRRGQQQTERLASYRNELTRMSMAAN